MPVSKTFDVVFSDTNFTTSITAVNESLTVNDVLLLNGLMPRDGTFRYVSSPAGAMINHLPVSLAPKVITVQNPKNIIQVWIDSEPYKGRTYAPSEDGKHCIFGSEKDTYANVFLTAWEGKNGRYGYTFSPNGAPYLSGAIVFLQVPTKGNLASLFDPQSGKEDYPLHLIENLEPMRGFWSAWQIGQDVNTATFREDLTPLPQGFKPWQPKIKDLKKINQASLPHGIKSRRIKMRTLTPMCGAPTIFTCDISKKNPSRNEHAIVCGVKSRTSASDTGLVVAWGNKTRPTMINWGGYQFGMSVFIKVPDEGRVAQVYNSIERVYVDCRITDSEDLRVNDLRGRWVIAQLRRHGSHKRILKLHSLPSDIA